MYDINSNIKSKSGLSADQLASAEKAVSPGNGYTSFQGFVDAESKYGINSLFILAHADIESAHGNSYYAKTRNNLFGFNAIDSDPNQASSYASQAASIDFYANFLNTHYLTPGAVYYNGTTPHGVFVKYSSSHDSEAQSVVGLMNLLESKITGQSVTPVPSPAPAAPSNPASGTYHVVSGDNLTKISGHYPGTNPGLWVAKNKVRYPAMTNDYIQAGWDLVIPGGNPSVPPPSASFVTAKPGDTVSGWGFAPPYTDFLRLNPTVSSPDKIFAGVTYRIK